MVVLGLGHRVRGKIVVDALALARTLTRPTQRSHGNSEISRSAFLSPSRDRWSSSFDYSIFRLTPSRFIRADEIQRSGEEERTANRKRKGRTQRASEETHGRGEKERNGEKEGRRLRGRERERRCTRFLQVRWVRSNSLLGRLYSYSSHSNDLSEKYSCYRAVINFDGLPSITSSLITNKFSKTFIDGIFYWRDSPRSYIFFFKENVGC